MHSIYLIPIYISYYTIYLIAMNEIKEFESNPGFCTQTIEMLASHRFWFSRRENTNLQKMENRKIKIIFCLK